MVDLDSTFYYLEMTIIQDCTNHILCLGQVGYLKKVFQIYGI